MRMLVSRQLSAFSKIQIADRRWLTACDYPRAERLRRVHGRSEPGAWAGGVLLWGEARAGRYRTKTGLSDGRLVTGERGLAG